MKTAFLASLLAVLPIVAIADTVASQDDEAQIRARVTRNPPTAATLTAEPYPGSRLDVPCTARQSAPRQPETMVYCFYTSDPVEKVKAYLAGPGKPADGVPNFVNGGAVVADEKGIVQLDGVTQILYYVSASTPAAKRPATPAGQSPAPVAPATGAHATQTASSPAAATAAEPPDEAKQSEGDDKVQDAVEKGRKLKSLLGF